jgi:hypothetical protein
MSGQSQERQGRRGIIRAEDGSITIEFVMLLPLLLALLAFAFEFGSVLIAHHTTVNHVRAASRYLARTQLTAAQIAAAEQIVRTGVPSGGVEPGWMADADIDITPSYSTFGGVNFREPGQVVRIRAQIDFPLTIFSFTGDDRPTIPFAVVDDMRFAGE